MMTLITPFLMATFIPLIIVLALSTIDFSSFYTFKNTELSSPFECGFSPLSKSRIPFSLRFFLLAVLFLIFDIEIVILLPSPILSSFTPTLMYAYPLIGFLMILILGLFHEWNEGSLEWV